MSKSEIQPNRFYSTDEIREVLHGRVKVDALRASGLVSVGNGYWGQNVIDSLNRHCESRARRDSLPQPMEGNDEIFEKTRGSNSRFHGQADPGKLVESIRE